MRSSHFKGIVWIVAFAVIALLAVTTGTAVAHELQHAAHHDAAMHGSGICAWMCATAGVHVATPFTRLICCLSPVMSGVVPIDGSPPSLALSAIVAHHLPLRNLRSCCTESRLRVAEPS
ncbi:MAG: hypothetical protein MRJ92_02995 [Nitrospira sp.]|nr:hypothetical protein [Nitrospira sp.]